MTDTHTDRQAAPYSDFQIAVEGSSLSLHGVTNGRFRTLDDLLFVIVPVFHHAREDNSGPGNLLIELALNLRLRSRVYTQVKTEYQDEGSRETIVQSYSCEDKLTVAVSQEWLPSAYATFLLRRTGTVEVYTKTGLQPFVGNADDFNPALARMIVVANVQALTTETSTN